MGLHRFAAPGCKLCRAGWRSSSGDAPPPAKPNVVQSQRRLQKRDRAGNAGGSIGSRDRLDRSFGLAWGSQPVLRAAQLSRAPSRTLSRPWPAPLFVRIDAGRMPVGMLAHHRPLSCSCQRCVPFVEGLSKRTASAHHEGHPMRYERHPAGQGRPRQPGMSQGRHGALRGAWERRRNPAPRPSRWRADAFG